MGIGSKVAGVGGLGVAGVAGAEMLAATNKIPEFSGWVNSINEFVSGAVQSTLSGVGIGSSMGVASEAIAGALTTAGVTGMTYVASKKVIEATLDKYAPGYSYLAKYLAMAPAAAATSVFGSIDLATAALGATAIAGTKLAFDGLGKNDAKGIGTTA